MTDEMFLRRFEAASLPSFEHRDHLRVAFLTAHPRLLDRDLLAAHYSRGHLFSAAARAGFVEPDLLALP